MPEPGQDFLLPSRETRHLRRTLRLSAGQTCLVLDPLGAEAEASIVQFMEGNQTLLRVVQKRRSERSPRGFRLRVYVALPQRGKMDGIVEKAQELCVDELCFLETERSAFKLKADQREKLMGRWRKITQEAAKQSGSLPLVQLFPPRSLKEALTEIPAEDPVAVFHPDAGALQFSDWLARLNPASRHHLLIGPEGGFSPAEVDFILKRPEAVKVQLMTSVLKTDTAFIGIVSALRFLKN